MASSQSALTPHDRPLNIDPALFEDSQPGYLQENTLFNDVDMQPPDSGTKAGEPPQDEEMADLFGNDDVEDVKQDGSASGRTSDLPTTPEKEPPNPLEYPEDEEPPENIVQALEANAEFPNIPVPRSSNGENWVIRMPNFVKVDSKPYHPDTYMGPEHDDEESQQADSLREKSMTIKLKVENTVRWRWIKDELGQDRRQSNSRIIRWSDGTLSLRLGKELFDINQSIDTSGAVPRQSFGGPQNSQTSAPSQTLVPGKSQGLTYLVAQHKRAQLLQSEALVTGYMTLRPTGMQSETHRMLVRAVGQKHNKVARLRMAPDPIKDPEREKLELMKLSAKNSKKKLESSGGRRRRAGGYSRHRRSDVWSDDDVDEGTYVASDEDEDDGMSSPRKKYKATDLDEKNGSGEYQEDDFVVADSSDDDGGNGNKKNKKEEEEVGDDPLNNLDTLEDKIRAQEDERRRKRDSESAPEENPPADEGIKVEDDEEMDVESEEEDELKVRRAGSGVRKKRAIDLYEEEDE